MNEKEVRPDRREFRERGQIHMPWSPGRTITARRAAEMLQVSRATIFNLVTDGTLGGFKLRPTKENSAYRINYESVVRYLERMNRALNPLK